MTENARNPASYLPRSRRCSSAHTSSTESDASVRVATPAQTPTTQSLHNRTGTCTSLVQTHCTPRGPDTNSARISRGSQDWCWGRLAWLGRRRRTGHGLGLRTKERLVNLTVSGQRSEQSPAPGRSQDTTKELQIADRLRVPYYQQRPRFNARGAEGLAGWVHKVGLRGEAEG